MIKNGENLALSGFTPAGVANAVTKELAKIALTEHEAGKEFKVGIFTDASTGQSTDGDLANAQAIKYRAPYTTNNDYRKHVNLEEIPYNNYFLIPKFLNNENKSNFFIPTISIAGIRSKGLQQKRNAKFLHLQPKV